MVCAGRQGRRPEAAKQRDLVEVQLDPAALAAAEQAVAAWTAEGRRVRSQ